MISATNRPSREARMSPLGRVQRSARSRAARRLPHAVGLHADRPVIFNRAGGYTHPGLPGLHQQAAKALDLVLGHERVNAPLPAVGDPRPAVLAGIRIGTGYEAGSTAAGNHARWIGDDPPRDLE